MTPIYLFDWNPTEKDAHAATLEAAGYIVERSSFSPVLVRLWREAPPQAVVISLDRRPSQGRDIGLYLRKAKATRHIPLVLVGGDLEKVEAIRQHLPDAVYTQWDSIHEDLAQAIAHPPANPVVPRSLFDPYAGAPLPKKLGIRPGSRVGLVDAPEGFPEALGALPEGVLLVPQPQDPCNVVLWFVREQEALARGLGAAAALARAGALWVIWPKKTSGVPSDLSQPVVRAAGLAAGLVDYKVCSVDQTWTGLCFRWRKPFAVSGL
jgi:hypothetical protein